MHKAEKDNNFSNQLQQQKMHLDDKLNNQLQLRFSSRITALEIQPVAFET